MMSRKLTVPTILLAVPLAVVLSACSGGGMSAESGAGSAGTAGARAATFPFYEEAEDPSPDTSADWSVVEPGLHASVGSIDQHYFRSSIPQLEPSIEWRGTAWRGEKVSAQLVLWSAEPIQGIEIEFSEFAGSGDANGQTLPSDIAQARFVRYVLTDEFADGCGYRKPEDFAVYLYPDGLDLVTSFDKAGNSTRPVWITIDVPHDAAPGTFTANARLSALGQEFQELTLELEVLPKTLPPPSEWAFHLDLWQNPYAVARMHEVEAWSEAHWELLRPIMQMLADAGQKVITATITEKPWASQTWDPFDSMVVWTRTTDGTWEFDYSVFDNWVQFLMDLGINRQINAYSLIPWTKELTYLDEATGEKVAVALEPGSPEYVELWTPFLIDFRAHLEEKGWNTITNIAMDEADAEDMQRMLDLMDELAPEFGIALADNKKSYQLYPDHIKDLCVSYSDVIDESDLEYRKAQGYPSTYYVCCSDPFPNTFTFSPPAEAAFIGWYAKAAGLDGFLRWSYNSWTEDPLRDSRFRTWPGGDTYIVYPDARSSIRFERLIEGIQDAEKIRILREELEAAGTPEARQKLELLESTLARFNIRERPADTEGLLNQGKRVLEELSR